MNSEKTFQKNIIDLLKSMGYRFITQEDNIKLRDGKLSEVLLKDILIEQLKKLNSYEYKGKSYQFSDKNIDNAVSSLYEPLNESLMSANLKISDQIILGNSYTEMLEDGTRKSFSLKYIDFENPENNLFHFTEEFSVLRQSSTNETRRPDLVLFINGIPFAVIELKKSSVETEQAISQMLRNQSKDEIPQLFKFTQILLAGNSHSPKYATTGTPSKFYSIWKENVKIDSISQREVTEMDKTIYSLFQKNRVLEFIKSFIIFDNGVKKIARYQQYFAIKEIMKKINRFDNNGRRNGGLVWHTQGSGKSLTMVMLTRVIKKEIVNSKIVVVTDRKDLDSQIHSTFNRNEIETAKANSGKELIKLLQGGKSVITTLIHKFNKVQKEKIIIDDPNIFILVDESHRTQNGDLNRAMQKVFPNGCYIGFTGTPLMKKEKSTVLKFGGLLHKYTIDQAVKDKAVLPLLYEGRLVEQWINDENGLDRKFEMLSKNLNDEQKSDLKRKWAKFQKVASSERRLEIIALDINEHFKKNIKGTGFKAMLATSSKYEAIKYHKIFEEYGDIKTTFVISAPDSREGYSEIDDDNKTFIKKEWDNIIKKYGNEDKYLEEVKNEFVDGDEIELLIVVSKLLTGFDAPRATVLYIDKKLEEHNLLQAIARVNRLYDGKDFGLIVDYMGLLGNLDKALTSYSSLDGFEEEDLVGTVFDIKEEIAKLKTYYSYLEELFKDINNKKDQESYEVFLGEEAKRKEFYEYLSSYGRSLKIALSSDKIDEVFSSEEIENYKSKMKFYMNLKNSIKIRYHEAVDFGKYEKQMQKLMDTFISANDVNQLTKLVNIFEEDFEKEIERVIGDNAKADTILSAVSAIITERIDSNPTFYEKLSKRIKEIIEDYKNNRLTDAEKLQNAKDVRKLLLSNNLEENYPLSIKNNSCAKAIFDNLKEIFSELFKDNDEILENVSIYFNNIFKEVSKKPDWKNNQDVIRKIESDIDEKLWELEDSYSVKFDNLDEIIKRIIKIGINNYS